MKTRTEIEHKLKESTNPDEIKLLEWVLSDTSELQDMIRQAIESSVDVRDQVKYLRYHWEILRHERLGLKESLDLIANYKG